MCESVKVKRVLSYGTEAGHELNYGATCLIQQLQEAGNLDLVRQERNFGIQAYLAAEFRLCKSVAFNLSTVTHWKKNTCHPGQLRMYVNVERDRQLKQCETIYRYLVIVF